MNIQRKPRSKRDKRDSRKDDRENNFMNRRPEELNNNEFQPQILRKPDNNQKSEKHEVNQNSKDSESVKKYKILKMEHSALITSHNHLNTNSLCDFIDPENSNFYVVGVMGMKFAGKSTLMNLLATGEIHRCNKDGSETITAPLFNDFKSGNGIEAFITDNRIILLDSAPILNNTSCREFIISEADDLRQVQVLLHLSHELIIIYEPDQLINLTRMLIRAQHMLQDQKDSMPQITLVENRVRPASNKNPITSIAKNRLFLFVNSSVNSFELPDITNSSPHVEDPIDVINQIRDDITTRKGLKAFDNPSETEKSWWDKFCSLRIEDGYFIQRFESTRDKYYQPNESDFQASMRKT